jgi:hypothetical protein
MKKISPRTILMSWVVGCVVFALIKMIILVETTTGGDQAPLEFLGNFIYIVIYGIIALSILIIVLYTKRSKEYWIMPVVIIFLCCLLLFAGWENSSHAIYSFTRVDTVIGGKEYIKQYEYYDSRSLRGISFFYNNKKDSIWTVYSESGKVISSLRYKEDTLIEVIK